MKLGTLDCVNSPKCLFFIRLPIIIASYFSTSIGKYNSMSKSYNTNTCREERNGLQDLDFIHSFLFRTLTENPELIWKDTESVWIYTWRNMNAKSLQLLSQKKQGVEVILFTENGRIIVVYSVKMHKKMFLAYNRRKALVMQMLYKIN